MNDDADEDIFDEGPSGWNGDYAPTTPPKSDEEDREPPSKGPRDVAEERIAPGPADPDEPDDQEDPNDDDPEGGYVPSLEGNIVAPA